MAATTKRHQVEIGVAVGVAVVAVTAVAIASAAQSFGHMHDWALRNGEPQWRALLLPVSVDGMMVAATAVLYVDHRLKRPVHRLAYWLLASGVAVSVAANVLHTWTHVFAEKTISAWGPLALFGSFELLVQFIRSLARTETVVDDTFRRLVHEWPTPIGPRAPATRTRKADDDAPAEPERGDTREHLHSVPVPIDRGHRAAIKAPTADDPFEAARAYYESETAAGRQPSGPDLARVTGQSRRTGARYLAKLNDQPEEVAVR